MSIYALPSGSGIIEIPRELLFETMLLLPGTTLINLCQTNRWFRDFCDEQNETFWKTKLTNDYPRFISDENYSSKTFYFKLVSQQWKLIDVNLQYYQLPPRDIGPILIKNTETLSQIVSHLFSKYVPNMPISIVFYIGSAEILAIYDLYPSADFAKAINYMTGRRITLNLPLEPYLFNTINRVEIREA